jgi:acyl-CoA thioester hydrolase
VAGIPIYSTAIQPEWIDYNGHVRDAYYGVIVSSAIDALMDRVGLDEGYRTRSGCTIYTLEMHLNYLQEMQQSDTAMVHLRVAGLDHKRILAAFEIVRSGKPGVAATAEVMLLHVRRAADKVASAAFPPQVSSALAELQAASAGLPADGPGSRRMELRPHTRA